MKLHIWRTEISLWSTAILAWCTVLTIGTPTPANASGPGTITTVMEKASPFDKTLQDLDQFGYVGHDASGAIYAEVGTSFGIAKTSGEYGDLSLARRYPYSQPIVALDGTVYDVRGGSIEIMEADGSTSRRAGTGTRGFSGDGGPAISAQINAAQAVSAPDGSVLFLDAGRALGNEEPRIRRIDPSGTISTIAGTGVIGYAGDGGPATGALIKPTRLSIDGSGRAVFIQRGLLFTSIGIRRVETNGTISTRYTVRNQGDHIDSAHAAPDGSIYFTERASGNTGTPRWQVFKIAPNGTWSAVAGTGQSGYTGDGGPAILANIGASHLEIVDVLPDGSVVINDGERFRSFVPGGTIDTLSGQGHYPYGNIRPRVAIAGDDVVLTDFGMQPAMGTTTPHDMQQHGWYARTPGGDVDLFTGAFSGMLYIGEHIRVRPDLHMTISQFNIPVEAPVYRPNGTLFYMKPSFLSDCNIYERLATGSTRTFHSSPCAGGVRRESGLATRPDGSVYGASGVGIVRIPSGGGASTPYAGAPSATCNPADGTPALNACLGWVSAMTTDGVGNLYVAVDNRVRRIDLNGIVTTVAGTAQNWPFTDQGDGGPATAATLAAVGKLAFDPDGNLYIATINRIRMVEGVGVMGAPPVRPRTAGVSLSGPLSAQVTWSAAPAGSAGAPASYSVTSHPGELNRIVAAPATSITFGGLDPATTYTFSVTANNAAGPSAPRVTNAVTTLATPGAPTGVQAARSGDRAAIVSWSSPPSDGGSPITGYRVTAQPGGVVRDVTATPVTFDALNPGTTYTFEVAALNAVGASAAASSAPVVIPAAPAGLVPLLTPGRVLDTRNPGGRTVDGQFATGGRVPANATIELTIAGRANIPVGAATASLNITAVNPADGGFLTIWPCGQPRPDASNLNYAAGDIIANSVISRLGDNGKVCIYSFAATDLLVDAAAYFPTADTLVPLAAPARVLDTRNPGGRTIDGQQAAGGRIPANGTIELAVGGRAGIPTTAATATLNITAVSPADGGFLTIWPCGQPRPDASNLNYGPGQIIANNIIARLGDGGRVCIYSYADTDLLVDAAGYFPTTNMLVPLAAPARVLDSRNPGGRTVDERHAASGRLPAGGTIELSVGGRAGIPTNASTISINVTAVSPADGGFLTIWPCGQPRPDASNLNYGPGQIIANNVIARLGDGGRICIYTYAATDVLVDAAAYIAAG